MSRTGLRVAAPWPVLRENRCFEKVIFVLTGRIEHRARCFNGGLSPRRGLLELACPQEGLSRDTGMHKRKKYRRVGLAG
jgi:hypothetical protein